MKLIAPISLVVVATAAGVWRTSALEEQAHERELFAAYCMGIFGPDQTSQESHSALACLTNEPADECSARIAEIDQERRRIDIDLRRLQEFLAAQGVIAPDRYTDACQIPRCNVVLGRPIAVARLIEAGFKRRRHALARPEAPSLGYP